MFCSKCGAYNDDENKLCKSCGEKLKSSNNKKKEEIKKPDFSQTIISKKKDSKPSEQAETSKKKTKEEKFAKFLEKEKAGKPFFEAGELFANRYELKEFLGRGGMGEVYKAYDKVTDDFTAIKMILPSLIDKKEVVNRFFNEAKISKEILHTNITRAVEFGEYEDIKYMVMEYIEGISLRKWIDDFSGEANIEEILNIMIQLIQGVGYAHGFTIHRDLKPENIMLTKDNVIKIMDFGIAKTLNISQVTDISSGMGTAYYMAPEQTRDAGNVDERADLFSLGVIFYEMITGKIPIGSFKIPTSTKKLITKEIGNIIKKALEPEVTDRFQSAQEMEQVLIEEKLNIQRLKLERKVFKGGSYRESLKEAGYKGGLRGKGRYIYLGVGIFLSCILFSVGIYIVFGDKFVNVVKLQRELEELESVVILKSTGKILLKLPADLQPVSDKINKEILLPVEVKTVKSKIELALIPSSDFFMGSAYGDGDEDEEPLHKVWVDSFYMGKYEVTNRQYKQFVEETGYREPINVLGKESEYTLWYNGDVPESVLELPTINISWYDANEFCKWLCKKEGVPEGTYRLPTEAEWEKAAKGLEENVYPWGEKAPHSGFLNFDRSWTGVETLKKVGSYAPNDYGLYDIAGNVWEWCIDKYDKNYYNVCSYKNPVNLKLGRTRVLRGGSWSSYGFLVRTSNRYSVDPDVNYFYNGFRVVRVVR